MSITTTILKKVLWIFSLGSRSCPVIASLESEVPREDVSFYETLTAILFGPGKIIQRSDDLQPMKVINIGLPRTATSSFVAAMKRLGLKSYHTKEAFYDSIGHFDMWSDHARMAFDFVEGRDHNGFDIYQGWQSFHDSFNPDWKSLESVQKHRDEIFEKIAQDGFVATADNPLLQWWKELIDQYPDVYVVLGQHPKGAAGWATSILKTVGRFQKVCDSKPWKWFQVVQKFKHLNLLYWKTFGLTYHGDDHVFRREDLEEFYHWWNREAEQYMESLGPKRKFLKFKATDGWSNLCEFMSPLSDSIQKKCAEMQLSGQAYPFLNKDLKRIVDVMLAISSPFEELLLIAYGSVSWLVTLMLSCALAVSLWFVLFR